MPSVNLGLVKSIHSGTTPPTNIQLLWYDTNTGVNIHKYYDVTLGAWTTLSTSGAISTHIADHDNPHQVTASQVGLGNVNNTTDTDKPVSTATQTALDLKSDKTHTHYVGNFDASLGSLPTTGTGEGGVIKKGDFWRANTIGTVPSVVPVSDFKIGDLLYASIDGATLATHFFSVNATASSNGGIDIISISLLNNSSDYNTIYTDQFKYIKLDCTFEREIDGSLIVSSSVIRIHYDGTTLSTPPYEDLLEPYGSIGILLDETVPIIIEDNQLKIHFVVDNSGEDATMKYSIYVID